MKKINSETHNFSEEEDLIDFLLIFKNLWKNRIQISRSTIAFFIIGCIVALTSPVIYEAQTTFVPQTSDENSSATKGLGSLASLAGINLNAEASSSIDNYISPLLYSKIIDSEEFSIKLLEENLLFLNGEKKTVKEYIILSEKPNPLNFITKIISTLKK